MPSGWFDLRRSSERGARNIIAAGFRQKAPAVCTTYCRGLTKDREPCAAIANRSGYCPTHRSQAEEQGR